MEATARIPVSDDSRALNPAPGRTESSASPSVGVCVLNWNGWRDTLQCLESLRQQDHPNFLTLVLDNHSLNDSVPRIRAWARADLPEVAAFVEYDGAGARRGGEYDGEAALREVASRNRLVFIVNQENAGFTGGCNLAIRYLLHRSAPVDYVLLINNDATLQRDCLSRLMAVAQEVTLRSSALSFMTNPECRRISTEEFR